MLVLVASMSPKVGSEVYFTILLMRYLLATGTCALIVACMLFLFLFFLFGILAFV